MATQPTALVCQTVIHSAPLCQIEENTRADLLTEPVRANQDPDIQPTIPLEAYVLMALLTLGGSATMEALLKKILDISPYWCNVAMQSSLHGYMAAGKDPAQYLRETFVQLFRVSSLPHQGRPSHGTSSQQRSKLQSYHLPSTSKVLLAKLPAELRNYIYELVLVYPSSGLCIAPENDTRRRNPIRHIFTKTRDHEASVPASAWDRIPGTHHDYQNYTSTTSSLKSYKYDTAVAIMQLNQGIREEASGIFFGANHFHFRNLKDQATYLKNIGDNRRHIRKLDFHYDARSRVAGQKVMDWIGQMELLEHLAMSIREGDLTKYKHWDEVGKFKGFPDLLRNLQSSLPRLRSFRLGGECVNVFRYLKPALEKRANYQELEFMYQGDKVCKASSPCLDFDCEDYHD